MSTDFYKNFILPVEEEIVTKQISMPADDWKILEAYRLYGNARLEENIPFKILMHQLIFNPIKADRMFKKEKKKWLALIDEISAQKEGKE